jgi:hypothetical protein
VVCPAIVGLPDVELAESCEGRPVSVVVSVVFQDWLRHCESGQLTCVVKGGRQRYKATSFGAVAFVMAQVRKCITFNVN